MCRAGLLLVSLSYFLWSPVFADCPPEGYSREALLELKAAEFSLDDARQRNGLAVDLLGCLGDPDPAIRDGVAYGALTAWLRGEQLETETIDQLYEQLVQDLLGPGDAQGYLQPFAVLALSEVARTDRVGNTFSTERRETLVNTAVTYLEGVEDYRGFSDEDGWRHGVAHGSDLVLQLVLNENIDGSQLERLVDAVLSQVAPEGSVYFVHGESGRLARAAFYAYNRGVLAEEFWSERFEQLGGPAPLQSWGESYASEAGLARRHNTLGFLMAMHVYASSGGEKFDALDQWVMGALGKIW